MRLIRSFICLACVCFVSSLQAAELPTPVGEEDFKALSELSPFSRPLDLSETLSLTGFARIGEKSVITLRDSESKKSHLVSGDINDEGWKLVEMSSDGDYGSENTFANIAIAGGEIVNLRFDAERLDSEHMRHRAGGKNSGPPRDNRLPPTKEEKEKWGKYIKERMSKLSETQRKEIGRIMGEKMKAVGQKMSDRQKGEMFVRIMDYVEKQGSSSGTGK